MLLVMEGRHVNRMENDIAVVNTPTWLVLTSAKRNTLTITLGAITLTTIAGVSVRVGRVPQTLSDQTHALT